MSIFTEKKRVKSRDSCIICFEMLKPMKDNSLLDCKTFLECNQCKKQFHSKCIDNWNKNRKKCPHCRFEEIEENLSNLEIHYYQHPYDDNNFLMYYHFFPVYFIVSGLIKFFIFLVFCFFLILYLIKLLF